MNDKLKLGSSLFLLGLFGVFSLLSIEVPLNNLPLEVIEKIPPQYIRFLILVNPTFLLLTSVTIGTLLYDKVRLTVPTISFLLRIEESKIKLLDQIKFGVFLGALTGFLIIVSGLVFKSSIPQEFIDLGNKLKITTFARFAYGGLTEELLMRFGFMTLVVWLVFKITKSLQNWTYWMGIILASFLFGVGHLPVVFSAVHNPSISLITYILFGNSIAGLFFGWLYWKKGLESAFFAHIIAHVVMIIGEQVFELH